MISRIGHVGLRVPSLERSVAHAEQTLGLRVAERDGDAVYLTCNDRHHELVLMQGDPDAPACCDHLGLEVFEPEAFAALRERVASAGLTLLDAPVERGVADAFRFAGPGGFVFEVFTGMAHDQPATYATVGARPRKFEHITVKSSRKPELEALLIDVLGLRLSDRAEDAISWLRASDEHHGISVIAAEADQLQHYAWQIDSFGAMATIGDRLLAQERTFLWGPGHHGIGDNYFSYFLDADGVIVEYSASIQRIDDDRAHEPRTWPDEPLSVNRWGNPPPPAEFVEGGTPLAPLPVAAGGR
jgi:catechol 2,3-dioxygenase-like lactoylglutathione lyase family enzyme